MKNNKYKKTVLRNSSINEGLFGFGDSSFDITDVFKKLPSALSFNGRKADLKWKLDNDGKPIITSNLVIPLSKGYGNFIQIVTVLSIGLQKKLFSLKQRISKSINNKNILREDFPLWENESFKSLRDLLSKIKDSLLNATTNKINELLNGSNMKESLVNKYRNLIFEKEDEGVIRKVGSKWKILKKNRKDYWDADYDTKADAQAALRAYWANKRECKRCRNCGLKLEDFTHGDGADLLKNVQDYLIKIFGPSLYFDHYTDKSVDLYYRGEPVAELLYNNKTSEITVLPDRPTSSPVVFYDTSEYEIKDYLVDLILGDV